MELKRIISYIYITFFFVWLIVGAVAIYSYLHGTFNLRVFTYELISFVMVLIMIGYLEEQERKRHSSATLRPNASNQS